LSTFLTEPKIYLVSRPSVDWEQIAAFLSDEDVPPIPESIRSGDEESLAIAEVAARMCYMSYGRGRRDIADFINNLLSSKDGSVFEHINYGFIFTGVSRSLTHELVRHRAGFAYSQRSQRYVDEADAKFVVPPAISGKSDDPTSKVLEKALENASKAYEDLVVVLEDSISRDQFEVRTDHRKAVRQAARSVLPNATETKIFVTGNVRAWRHFIEMRGAVFADWEIRKVAILVLEQLQKESDLLFGDFSIDELPDGTKTATPKYSKV